MTVIPFRSRASPSQHSRVRLALSILNHRAFCRSCQPHVDQARLALYGKTIEQITDNVNTGQ